jgi:3-hydroxybutyryl-CoA dehydrogenase
MSIENVAVIGAGTMGAGIAQVCAQTGWNTTLYDAYPESLERGMQRISAFWDKGILKGKTSQEQKQVWSNNLQSTSDLSDAVSQSIDTMTSGILATNTSSLSIQSIAEATSRPHEVIGMHFFNPVPIMELLELVKHDLCSSETIDFAQNAGAEMGKTTILVNDIPGFATSRLGVVLGNEAIRMLADGVANAEDIDKAMTLGYRHPMGPLRLTDLVGLDVRRDILLNLKESFGDDRYTPHPLLEEMITKGMLGKKSGKGFFEWD